MTLDEKKQLLRLLDDMEKQLSDLYGIMPTVATPLLQKVRIIRGFVL